MCLQTDTHTEPNFHWRAKGSNLSSQNQHNFSATEIPHTDEKISKSGVFAFVQLIFL